MFVVTDALSVYLTGPSTPPGDGTSTDLSTSVNLYLESGEIKPSWVQVNTYSLFMLYTTDLPRIVPYFCSRKFS